MAFLKTNSQILPLLDTKLERELPFVNVFQELEESDQPTSKDLVRSKGVF